MRAPNELAVTSSSSLGENLPSKVILVKFSYLQIFHPKEDKVLLAFFAFLSLYKLLVVSLLQSWELH